MKNVALIRNVDRGKLEGSDADQRSPPGHNIFEPERSKLKLKIMISVQIINTNTL